MASPILLAVPNVSEGRDAQLLGRLAAAAMSGAPESRVRLLDTHSDRDHHRAVFTLAGPQRALAGALLRLARAAVGSIDVVARAGRDLADAGAHPHVGAVDVVPLVYLDAAGRGAACAEALVVADRIAGELHVPVFLYGELAGDRPARTRAELRRGGVTALAARLATGSADSAPDIAPARSRPARDGIAVDAIHPDFGPQRLHPSAGATLVAAREPLVAFNLQLHASATIADARRVAAIVREGGEHGLPGLRAIGVELRGGVAQVSMNVERPLHVSLAEVVSAVARRAPVASAELVGLAPRAAFDGFPRDLPMPAFDPARHLIENALVDVTAEPDPHK